MHSLEEGQKYFVQMVEKSRGGGGASSEELGERRCAEYWSWKEGVKLN